jgi:hypothetical protein
LKNLIALIFSFCFFIEPIKAQQKSISKADTSKQGMKNIVKTDSSNTKTPLNFKYRRYDDLDSTTLQKLEKNNPIKKFGVIDTSDLRLAKCDFEKGANAMVLFDYATMWCGEPDILINKHKRILIFNENGKDEGNIIIKFDSRFGRESVYGLVAETINLVNGKIEITKLDPKLIYASHDSKNREEIRFSMPNIKPASVIEYSYYWERESLQNIPEWIFQSHLPTRYSQITTILNPFIGFSVLKRTNLPFDKDTVDMLDLGHVWAIKNIPSAKVEPYMRSEVDALQSIKLIIKEVKLNAKIKNISTTWADVGKEIIDYKGFTKPFEQGLHDEDVLIKQANSLKTDEEKVAYLFNQVKETMRWDESENWISNDGIKAAWKKKSGNWGEINMILHHLLKLAGVKAYPMVLSTRDNGQILANFANIYQINKLVTYVPVDSAKYFILDATNKFNVYNEIPYDLLNSYGLVLDKNKNKFDLLFIKKDEPSKQFAFINAEIKPNGVMTGMANIASYSYNKSINLELHKKLDEKQYYEYLTNNDNNLKIKSLKMENAEVDSLPLIQNIEFNLELPGTDDKYIYFNPNLFTNLYSNPFIIKSRVSDIDFGCNKSYKISGRYTMPAGYKVESIPNNINLIMDDQNITFKRLVVVEDGLIQLSYIISFKKSFYVQAEYPGIYTYFKKMNEALNEPIVLKKQ